MLVGGSGGKLEVWEFGVLLQDGGLGCGGGRGGRVGELEVWGSAIGRCESEVFLRKKCFIVLNSVRQNLIVSKFSDLNLLGTQHVEILYPCRGRDCTIPEIKNKTEQANRILQL